MLLKSLRVLLLFAVFLFASKSYGQCFDIETILVAACDSGGATPDEGFNEMVRFKVGPAAINTSTMIVNFPSNTWQGLIQNSVTAAKVIQLNNQIAALGGCAQLLQPTAGVLPANAKVILVTSQNFSVSANVFGPISQNMYIIFQNNTTQTGGHFGNYGSSSFRTLTMSFGACTDTVTYDRSLLVTTAGLPGGGNGSSVNFTPAGIASYFNVGCFAPVDPFTVDAGTVAITPCAGNTINLAGTAQGYSNLQWSATSGAFGSANSLSSTYTVPSNATGTIQLTLTATNTCGTVISDVVNFSVAAATVPNFSTTLALCSGAPAPALNATSPNGISGTWSPTTINNTTGNTYVFTPNSGQCATTANTVVTVSSSNTPDFSPTLALCSGAPAPTLNATSPNGISGTWNPTTISNSTGNTYVFTPNSGQCATTANTLVSITAQTTPNFATTLALCSGAPAPALNVTSPNGISGTWNPTTINNTIGNTYVFTPTAGQCANSVNTVVTISPSSMQTATYSICLNASGQAINPVLIDTGLAATDYVFTWTKDGTALSNTTPSITATAVGVYVAQATNLITNCIVTLTATVQTVPKATASAIVTSDFDSAQIISVTVSGGQGPYSFQLNGGPTQMAPDFTIYQGGDYQIHISEPSGCNTIDLEVTALFYPKFFTPNGDGFNDTWNINSDSLQDNSELYVFDRLGKLLKQLAPNGPGWNGTFNGHPLPSSDYWFLLKYISTTGQAKEYKANFSLKR